MILMQINNPKVGKIIQVLLPLYLLTPLFSKSFCRLQIICNHICSLAKVHLSHSVFIFLTASSINLNFTKTNIPSFLAHHFYSMYRSKIGNILKRKDTTVNQSQDHVMIFTVSRDATSESKSQNAQVNVEKNSCSTHLP